MSSQSLQAQIESGRQTIRAESYAMSIGELVNLYKNSELVIRPEFQRLFRWSIAQKSRLIESLLLGIPLPSIFVMQREDGIWEVIDGLQRLSTILEFMGELKSEDGLTLEPASTLVATAYLPSLADIRYGGEDERDAVHTLTPGQRLGLKRAKLDVKILLPESDAKSKFELFDRLNAGGSIATPQEIRNAQLIMRDPRMFEWLESLRAMQNFQDTLSITSRLYDESYDAELVCRYLVLSNSEPSEWNSLGNMDDFLSAKIFEFTLEATFKRSEQAARFSRIFDMLEAAVSDDSFRRFERSKGRFLGGFSVSAFEAITVGLSKSLEGWTEVVSSDPDQLRERIQSLWDNQSFREGSGSGIRASTRIPKTLPAAIQHFSI